MKRARMLLERKSQVFVAVLIAFTIMLTLGAAILMHSRSVRTSAKQQTDAQKAYFLAQNGIEIGTSYALKNSGGMSDTYKIGGGEVTVTVVDNGGTKDITAQADYKGTQYVATKQITSETGSEVTTWVKSYGGSGDDYCLYVNQTVGVGGYILGGTGESTKGGFGSGGEDILLLKVNENGDVGLAYPGTWAYAYGGGGEETIIPVFANTFSTCPINQGYIAAATSTSFSSGGSGKDLLLVKVAANGDMEWARGFRGGSTDEAYAVIETLDGGYLLGGVTATKFTTVEGPAIRGQAMLLIKTDKYGRIGPDAEPGSTTWAKLYDNQASGTDTDEYLTALEEDAGNYIVVGRGWHVDSDGHILKINKSNGNIVAQKRYGTPKPGLEIFQDVAKDGAGGYVIVGVTDAAGPVGSNANACFIKLDSNLEPVGTGKAYDQNSYIDRGFSIKSTPAGYALVNRDAMGSKDFLLLQTDASGTLNVTTSRRYGQLSPVEVTTSLDSVGDKGLIIGGYATQEYLGSGGYNWLVVRVNSAGGLMCAPDISSDPVSLSSTDFPVTEVLNAGSPIPLTNFTISSANLDDVDLGPAPGSNKIFRTSAASITVVDNCVE